MKKEQYQILDGGRVKLAGGSVNTYYNCAQPIIEKGMSGAYETATNFKDLRNKPPTSLLLAFFPENPKNIKQRLRGAGLYRHLRMDQGPGGNFTAFNFSDKETNLGRLLTTEQGYALLEYSVQEQINTGQFGALIPLIQEIQKSFQKNDYRQTAQQTEQFQFLCAQSGLLLPNGENTGSKTGFFFIRPTHTDTPTKFPMHAISEVKEKVAVALKEPESLAEYARRYIREGKSYDSALSMAENTYREKGHVQYNGNGLLYFQPDCFVSRDGEIQVEKINMPDVGFFLTQIRNDSNAPLADVQHVNMRLRAKVDTVIASSLRKTSVTLVTRDEVVNQNSDTLELLEIQALCESLKNQGKKVHVLPLSAYKNIDSGTQVMLLNVNTDTNDFARFTEKIVRNDIICYPDPLLRAFQEKATTMKRITLEGKKLGYFLNFIKPKDLNAQNSIQLQQEIFKYLDIAGIKEDIMYVTFPGLKTPIPVFRYSIHSFFQIYNAIQKELERGRKIDSIHFSPVPFEREKAMFKGADGPRISAFRFMFTK